MSDQSQKQEKPLVKYISIISNVLLAMGAAIGIFVLAKAYLFTGELPAGACPLTVNRPWIYLSIALLLTSLILSFFEPRKQRDKTEPAKPIL